MYFSLKFQNIFYQSFLTFLLILIRSICLIIKYQYYFKESYHHLICYNLRPARGFLSVLQMKLNLFIVDIKHCERIKDNAIYDNRMQISWWQSNNLIKNIRINMCMINTWYDVRELHFYYQVKCLLFSSAIN